MKNLSWRQLSKTGLRNGMAAALLLALGMGVGWTQRTGIPGPTTGIPQDPLGQVQDSTSKTGRDDDAAIRHVSDRQAKLREEDRQKRLVADTERLLSLATQLHDDVSKTNKNILSLDVVKRADEIEKLAHSVKEKMKE